MEAMWIRKTNNMNRELPTKPRLANLLTDVSNRKSVLMKTLVELRSSSGLTS